MIGDRAAVDRSPRRAVIRRFVLGVPAAFLAGMAIVLEFHGLHDVAVESGSWCTTGGGEPPCPRGFVLTSVLPILGSIVVVPLAAWVFVWLLFTRRWLIAFIVVVVAFGGALTGDMMHTLVHG